jgi:hypothetical protein
MRGAVEGFRGVNAMARWIQWSDVGVLIYGAKSGTAFARALATMGAGGDWRSRLPTR